MVLLTDFAEFEKQVKAMYEANPSACRFTVKTKQPEQELVLKATDDIKSIKLKVGDGSSIKKLEKLTRWMVDRMISLEIRDLE